jgi:hypothetical protein
MKYLNKKNSIIAGDAAAKQPKRNKTLGLVKFIHNIVYNS